MFQKLALKYKTPKQVQSFLRGFKYNREENGETLRSAHAALKAKKAHCLEATFIAAAILEHHGHPPLVVSFESKDYLDHVIYVYRQKGLWGSIARSRDEGLHGRPPVFKSLRHLAWSYYEPYVDKTGMIKSYQVFHLDETLSDWRTSLKNVWHVERYLSEQKYIPLKTSRKKYLKLYKSYLKNGPIPYHPLWW